MIWTEDKISILKEYYSTKSAQYLIDNFNFDTSVKAIQKKARELGIYKNHSWNEQEDSLLREHWVTSDMETLKKVFPNRSYNSLVSRASFLGLHSLTYRQRKGDLSFLDNLNCKSAYWWGFITADGHLSPRGDLLITISERDKEYLEVLAKRLKCVLHESVSSSGYSTPVSKFITLRVGDKKFQKKWYALLKYNNPKTYNPLDLSVFYRKELLIYFLIGLIDGDGSIWISNKSETNRGSIALRLEMHPNWEAALSDLCNKVYEFYQIKFNIKRSKKGYIKAEIATKNDLLKIYSYINNCDYMPRKWNKVSAFVSQ